MQVRVEIHLEILLWHSFLPTIRLIHLNQQIYISLEDVS